MISRHLMAVAFALLASSAVAQTPPAPAQSNDPGEARTPLPADRGYDKPSPRTDAINAPNRDALAAANRTAAHSGVTFTTEMRATPAYVADLRAYDAAVRRADADQARYERQRMAYADAMWVWRLRTEDCRRGIVDACNQPTPVFTDYD